MNNNFFLKLSKFFLYLAPFALAIVSRGTLFPFIVGKYVFFRIAVELALISFLWAWARNETQNYADNTQTNAEKLPRKSALSPLKSALVAAVSIFVLVFLLAGFLGYNPSASFWSNFERGEGGLQMLHLFVFFVLLVLLFRDEKSWRKMLAVSLWAAGLVVAYGLGAAMGVSFLIGSNLCTRFAASLGNPAYIGTYMIFALFFSVVLLNEEIGKPRKWLKWLLLILLVVFFLALLFSQTRGALLGLGVGIIGGLTYLFFRLPKGRLRQMILASILILAILGGLGFKFRRSIDLMPFCKGQGGNRILDINLGTETFQTRLLLWSQAIKITAERPLLGWGPENFSLAFEKHYNPKFAVWYDRAHSVYFDYLAETGILGLLSYLGIFVVLCWQFIKKSKISNLKSQKENKQKLPIVNYQLLITNALIFSLPIAYLIQGVVLFDVLPIYINLFLFLAFVNYKFNKQ